MTANKSPAYQVIRSDTGEVLYEVPAGYASAPKACANTLNAHKRPLKVVEQIAQSLQARINCVSAKNDQWFHKHTDTIMDAVARYLPRGSGFDCGTEFDFEASRPDRLQFRTSFHHMVDGMYDGWTEHAVIVKPSFVLGFDMRVTGRDRDDIKDYIAEAFHSALSADYLTKEQEHEERLWQEANAARGVSHE